MSQERFSEAIRLEEAGDLQGALAIYRQLAADGPRTRNLFLRIGRLAQELELTSEAEQAFHQALEIDGRCAVALQALGTLALDQSEYDRAAAYLQRAREIKEDPGRLSLLGVALRHSGREPEAEEAYRRALQLDESYEEAHFNLGALLRDERPDEARAHLLRALELDPDYAPAHRELGYLLWAGKTNAEAERHLRKAVELAPGDAWARLYLGGYLSEIDPDGAWAELQAATMLRPHWSLPLEWLGELCEERDPEAAQAYFEQARAVEDD